MNYNTDGFSDRTLYVRQAVDRNKLNSNGPSNFDNSFAKMKSEERKHIVETVNTDKNIHIEEVHGNRENFVIRNNNLNNFNKKVNPDNPVQRALNNNMFKRPN